MPRQARKKSASEIYHIMLRGINQQQIFEEEDDCNKFISILRACKEISGFKLFAYCLMGNHIHLLIKQEKETLEQIFKRIGGRFVYWYNAKYQRSGHLFQDRFKSEPVENDAQFLTTIRYIHQNPLKAGMCEEVSAYKYSSYHEYMGKGGLVDVDFVYEIISPNEFIRFNNESNSDKCIDINNERKCRFTDEQAQKIMMRYSGCNSAEEFQKLDIATRNKWLKMLAEKGLSVRQISRITGISHGIVRRSVYRGAEDESLR